MNTSATTIAALQKFCFTHDGLEIGPCTASELKEQVRLGQLTPDDLVWRAGAHRKRPAKLVSWLFPSPTDREAAPAVSVELPLPHPAQRASSVVRSEQAATETVGSPALTTETASVESKSPPYQAVVEFAQEICATTIQYGRRFAVAGGNLIQGKTTLSEVAQIWPQDTAESNRLAIGCCTCVLTLLLLVSLWPSSTSSPQSFPHYAFALPGSSPAIASSMASVTAEIQKQQSQQRQERDRENAVTEKEVRRLLAKAADLHRSKKFHAAQTTYEQAIKLAPQTVDAHVGLADTFFELGESSNAISSLWRAVDRAKGDKKCQLDLLVRISGHSFESEKYPIAVSAMEQAIALEPEEGAYRFTAGVASLHGRNYRQAIRYFEAALEYFQLAGQTGSWEYKAYVHMATAHQHLGETSQAIALCEQVLSADPNNIDAQCVRDLITSKELQAQNESRRARRSLGPAAFFPPAGSFPGSFPGSTGTSGGSTYDYLTPHQAGKLGVIGLQIIPGQHMHHFRP